MKFLPILTFGLIINDDDNGFISSNKRSHEADAASSIVWSAQTNTSISPLSDFKYISRAKLISGNWKRMLNKIVKILISMLKIIF